MGPSFRLRFTNRKKTPIFFYSQVPWDSVWQRPQEIAMGLSRYRDVIFYSPVQLHELPRLQKDQWEFVRRLEGGRLTILSPIIFSGEYRSRVIRELNATIQVRYLRRMFGKTRPLLLTNSPFPKFLLDYFGWKHVGLDFIDDFCAFDWALPDSRMREEEFLYRADFAFAGTEFLREKYSDKYQNLEFLPSGVNYQDFAEPKEEPEEIKNLPRPRLVYGGSLSDRLDGGLFLASANANPNGSVIIAGPRHASFQCPKLPENVFFLGMLPHKKLPALYQHSDIGLLPFSETSPAARATHPIKILEYFAAGLPVITTPIPDVVAHYSGLVEIASSSEWSGSVHRMLKEKRNPEKTLQRQKVALARSWESLVNQIKLTIDRVENEN